MANENPIDEYHRLLSNSDFLFIVYYRGHWCPFCMAYLTQLHTIESAIAAAGGSVVAVTSEPDEHLQATRDASGLQAKILVDTDNSLAAYLNEQALLDIAISKKNGYVNGMAQPGVLVLRGGKVGDAKPEILEKWAIVPSLMNMGGATDRPDLTQIWDNVQAKLKGEKVVHAKYSLLKAFGVLRKKVFG